MLESSLILCITFRTLVPLSTPLEEKNSKTLKFFGTEREQAVISPSILVVLLPSVFSKPYVFLISDPIA